jgi:hypothetical protein
VEQKHNIITTLYIHVHKYTHTHTHTFDALQAEISSFDGSKGHVTIRFSGEAFLKYGIEDTLRQSANVRSVEFID